MKTIEIYEQTDTVKLQSLLKEYEDKSEGNDTLIVRAKFNDDNYDELQKISDDYEIDIHLIRMELTKRLWCGTFEEQI